MEKVEREDEGKVEDTERGEGEKERGKYWGNAHVCLCVSILLRAQRSNARLGYNGYAEARDGRREGMVPGVAL